MKLPCLTHLQFLILDFLKDGTQSATFLMAGLKEWGESREGSGFYQLMKRLEDAKIVKGEYRSLVSNDRRCRERIYTLTKTGKNKYNECLDFYKDKNPFKKGDHEPEPSDNNRSRQQHPARTVDSIV